MLREQCPRSMPGKLSGSMSRNNALEQCPGQCPAQCISLNINNNQQYSIFVICLQVQYVYRYNMSTGTILFNLCVHQSTVVPANADQCRSMQVNIGIYSIKNNKNKKNRPRHILKPLCTEGS